jgi:hypothetical protein
MEGFIEVMPDRERARSLMGMVEIRLDTIKLLEAKDPDKFASKVTEEYYEALLEIITAIISLDGYKTRSDSPGSHINSINYMRRYEELSGHEIELINDMRKKRAGIKYYGRNVSKDYIDRRESDIKKLFHKLKSIATGKLGMKNQD